MFTFSGLRWGDSSGTLVCAHIYFNVEEEFLARLLSVEKLCRIICRELGSVHGIRVDAIHTESTESSIKRIVVVVTSTLSREDLESQAISLEHSVQLYPAVIHAPCGSDAKVATARLRAEPRSREIAREAIEWLQWWVKYLHNELATWRPGVTKRILYTDKVLLRLALERLTLLRHNWPDLRGG